MKNLDRPFSARGDLYEHIRRGIVHLVVMEGSEPISIGTGFIFTSDAAILTAAHVIAGGWPVKPGEVDQPNRTVVAFIDGAEPQLYRPAICPFEIRGAGIKPMQLDIAILVAVNEPIRGAAYLTASTEPPKLGDEMYFAGYSEEVEFPFLLDRHLRENTAGLDTLKRGLCTGITERLAGPLIKRATVGNVIFAEALLEGRSQIKQTAFYLDNQIHSGASGGPIVATDGTVRGIISKRSITKVGDLMVPGGSTLGLGLEPLLALTLGQNNRSA